jgi:hypothetical protein
MMQKTGLSSLLYSSLGETETIDDNPDHWSSNFHALEKLAVIQMLQDMSLARGFRFTFLSGGVHVAGQGRTVSQPQVNLRHDHRFMPQVQPKTSAMPSSAFPSS